MVERTRVHVTLLGEGAEADAWARTFRGAEGVDLERLDAADETTLARIAPSDATALAVCADVADLASVVRRALLARRHVFVAGAAALASKHLTAIDELARARSRIVMFDAGGAGDERFAFVRRMVAGPHALWRPRYIRSLRAGGEAHLTLDQAAIADIHALLSLAGAGPARVSALAPRIDDETGAGGIVAMTVVLDGGPVARIDISLAEPRPAHEITVVCDGRTIALDAYDLRAPLQILASARHSGPATGANWAETVSEHPVAPAHDRAADAAEAFLTAVRAGDASVSNVASVAVAAATWEAARASMAQGGEWVACGRTSVSLRPELQLIKGGGRGGDALHAPTLTLVPRQAAVPDPPRSA